MCPGYLKEALIPQCALAAMLASTHLRERSQPPLFSTRSSLSFIPLIRERTTGIGTLLERWIVLESSYKSTRSKCEYLS